MPEIFWNAGRNDRVTGLDVLGLRGFDQDFERQWVAGITTISFRARYLSLLPWVCAEFFQRQLTVEPEAAFDQQRFDTVLRRLEALVFFCTHVGLANGETGRATGVIGTDLFREEGQRLDKDQIVDIPTSKGGSVLGTYFMPCRAFGLIDWPIAGSPLPVSVPPRGRALWQARATALAGVQLADHLFEGGALSRTDVIQEGRFFSVNNVQSIPLELELLQSAFLTPAPDADRSTFERLQQTIEWGLGEVNAAPRTAAENDPTHICQADQGAAWWLVSRRAGVVRIRAVSSSSFCVRDPSLCTRQDHGREIPSDNGCGRGMARPFGNAAGNLTTVWLERMANRSIERRSCFIPRIPR